MSQTKEQIRQKIQEYNGLLNTLEYVEKTTEREWTLLRGDTFYAEYFSLPIYIYKEDQQWVVSCISDDDEKQHILGARSSLEKALLVAKEFMSGDEENVA